MMGKPTKCLIKCCQCGTEFIASYRFHNRRRVCGAKCYRKWRLTHTKNGLMLKEHKYNPNNKQRIMYKLRTILNGLDRLDKVDQYLDDQDKKINEGVKKITSWHQFIRQKKEPNKKCLRCQTPYFAKASEFEYRKYCSRACRYNQFNNKVYQKEYYRAQKEAIKMAST